MSATENTLLRVHKRLAGVLGQIAWSLARRGLSRAERDAWLAELHAAIEEVERL